VRMGSSPHGVTSCLDEGAPFWTRLAVYPRRWQGVTHLRPPGKHGPREDRIRYIQAYDADSGKRLFSGGCPQGWADTLTNRRTVDSPGDVRLLYFKLREGKRKNATPTSKYKPEEVPSFPSLQTRPPGKPRVPGGGTKMKIRPSLGPQFPGA
jgi:hypothetical protein